jgi:hypothetical protein
MMTVLFLAACLPIQAVKLDFVGGSDFDLCHAIAETAKAPVFVLAESDRKWEKVAVSADDLKSLRLKVRSKLGLDPSGGGTWGLSAAAYPRNLFWLQYRPRYRQDFAKANPHLEQAGGQISLSTPDGAVCLSAVFSVQLKKRVTWHWFFDDCMLAGEADGVDEDAYVRCVAEALGAKVVDRESEFYLDFDPVRYRARALAELDAMASDPLVRPFMVADCAYDAACLNWLTDDQLRDLFSNPANEREYDSSADASVTAAAKGRLETHFPVHRDNVERSESALTTWKTIAPQIDWSRAPHIVANTSGMFSSKYFGPKSDYLEWVF